MQLRESFRRVFPVEPLAEASAPGRVNLLGEHTDYNDGFVLPVAIPQRTTVLLGHSPDSKHHVYSEKFDADQSWAPDQGAPPPGFSRLIFGCLRELETNQVNVPPLSVFVSSQVPIGAGLSSSAALSVALLRALRSLLKLEMDDVHLALVARDAEVNHTEVQCGIMDQMASSLAEEGQMLFLDTRTLNRRLIPLPPRSELLVIDSGNPRQLVDSAYNERREACAEAARRLGVRALRDVREPSDVKKLEEPFRSRAWHVVRENVRVLEAACGVPARSFGRLMNASHASLRDDFEVSTPDLDRLVELLQGTEGVFGARLTGAGFGGACVALVEKGAAARLGSEVLGAYNSAECEGWVLVPTAS